MLFGGYTSISWNYDHIKEAGSAFIFSLNKKTQHYNYTNKNSIFSGLRKVDEKELLGFGFGGGDIWINNNCKSNNYSYSYLGTDFELPIGIAKDSNKANSYLAGSHRFKVLEIETFAIKFI